MINRRDETKHEALSPREGQLLEMAVAGLTDQAIANKLGLSLSTVSTYWGRVRIKLGPFNRTELVALYLKEESEHALSSLKKENRDLLFKMDGHAQTVEALEAALELYKGLINDAPDAILVVNGDGTLELANAWATRMFGFNSDEMIGKTIESLIPARFFKAHLKSRADYLASPDRRNMGKHAPTMALHKSGQEFPIAAALSASATPNGPLVICIIRDLSSGRPTIGPKEWHAAPD